jgi:trypsin
MNFVKWISISMIGLAIVAQADVSNKIVGGVQTKQGELPFIVSLQQKSFGHFCGGSLISQKWVLTAAHCIGAGAKGGIDEVWIGVHDQTQASGIEKMKVARVIKHSKYNSSKSDFDFALIELAQNSSFKPISLNLAEIAITDDAKMISTTAGWGATSQGSSVLPSILRKVDVPLVSQAACNEAIAYNGKITSQMICAGYKAGGKDSCQGDSGGPLFITGRSGKQLLVGVVSWGQGCALKNKYGVYAKVNSVQAWIKSNTGIQ